MDAALTSEITEQLRALVRELAPDAGMRPMYGGTVIEMVPGVAKSRVGGVYAYGDYVSLELARGAQFDDPGAVLEGSGKLRRHVKLRSVAEIAAKGCDGFLRQAIAGWTAASP